MKARRPLKKLFTAETDEYVILTLLLTDFQASQRILPPGYTLLPEGVDYSAHRQSEKKLLRHYFVAWSKPFDGSLPGFRRESPVFVTYEGKLVAGVYVCEENELQRSHWGQLHYAFIDPSHSGKGIYSVIFKEAVERARRWKLEGLVLTSDRFMLPEVYLRWGATRFKTVRKSTPRKIAGKLWNMFMRNSR